MNTHNMQQIFAHYIDKFEEINYKHEEYYKWQICNEFPRLMQEALSSSDEDFSRKLLDVKKLTENIIDSYTQPFFGLVQFARESIEGTIAVRKLLQDLYIPDNNDLAVRMEKIENFFAHSKELLDKFFPGSYLYAQNSHSVSSLLFLNDPDNHYMYKATQSKIMADCIQFYDDWGTGDNIDLKKYYRMCDEITEAVKACPELLKTNESRYDGRLNLKGGTLHPDKEKHILVFDIIYCCSNYDLFNGISFDRPKMKERQLYAERKAKAEELRQYYQDVQKQADELETAIECFSGVFHVGDTVVHRKFGEGTIRSLTEKYLTVYFLDDEEEKMLSLYTVIGMGLVTMDNPHYQESVAKYKDLMMNAGKIAERLERAASALKEYEEYLD